MTALTPCAQPPRLGWAALAFAVLLATGCATLETRPGLGAPGHSAHAWKRMAGGAYRGEVLAPAAALESAEGGRVLRRSGREPGSAVARGGTSGEALTVASCVGNTVPPGWPDFASGDEERLLAPFLACASPADFVALQRRVDMARLVEALDDWSAVRLGALGPLRAEAAAVLTRKRAAFLLKAAEKYGLPRAEVFALFILHSAFDDEARELLRLLARDKQLGETLGRMGAVREELARRGMRLANFPDREERPGDVLRGLGRAARDVLSSPPMSDGARYVDFTAKQKQLPPPYQQALEEVEQALIAATWRPGNVMLAGFDSLTFGVPLGFYHLAVGTGHGVQSLAQGRYEQATRELAPAALVVGLYAGGKGVRYASEAAGTGKGVRLQGPALHLEGLKGVAQRLGERLGTEGLGQLARHIQASREAALLVCEGGEAAALALHEARGNVARAQAWLSEAKPQRAGPSPAKASTGRTQGGVASLVDEAAGLTREVVEAKFALAELEATGPRLSGNVAVLQKRRPAVESPPPGAQGHPLWREYVAYFEKRLAQLREGRASKPPLAWEGYGTLRGRFARGLAFERTMVARLRADAALPRARRRWLKDFNKPRIETNVGVTKPGAPGVRYADALVIEEAPRSGAPKVETFSFKSRDFSWATEESLKAQMVADASDALRYYGETLNIRRPSLHLRDSPLQVHRVRLVYEGGKLKPTRVDDLNAVVREAMVKAKGVEVSFQ